MVNGVTARSGELKPNGPPSPGARWRQPPPGIERNNTPQTLPHDAKLAFGAVDETGRPGELRSPWIRGSCPHARLCSMRRLHAAQSEMVLTTGAFAFTTSRGG